MITPLGEIPNRLAAGMSLSEQYEWLARRVSRRSVLSTVAVGALALATPTLWRQSSPMASAGGVGGRHLSYGGDPTTELTVEFTSEQQFTSATVELLADGDHRTAPAIARTVIGSNQYYGRADFTGLKPGTSYAYTVTVDGHAGTHGTARTIAAEPAPFRFSAFGDQGVGADQLAVIDRVGLERPALHLMCGDICYADSTGLGGVGDVFRPHRWDRWLAQNDPVAGVTPFLSVPGNHDMEPGYDTHGYAGMLTRMNPGGRSPVGVPTVTSLRIANVLFLGLDSNDVSYEIPANRGWTGGAQTRWLEEQLSAARATGSGIDFIVTFMHAAPYSTNNAHASEGGIIQEWVPLFDRYSVDLSISGHNHCYERTEPIRRGQAVHATAGTPFESHAATTYITAGGGGQGGESTFIKYVGKTRVATSSGLEAVSQDWSTNARSADTSVLVVDVSPATWSQPAQLHARAVRVDGSVLDEFWLTRGRALSSGILEEAGLIGAVGGAAAALGLGAWATTRAVKRRSNASQAPVG